MSKRAETKRKKPIVTLSPPPPRVFLVLLIPIIPLSPLLLPFVSSSSSVRLFVFVRSSLLLLLLFVSSSSARRRPPPPHPPNTQPPPPFYPSSVLLSFLFLTQRNSSRSRALRALHSFFGGRCRRRGIGSGSESRWRWRWRSRYFWRRRRCRRRRRRRGDERHWRWGRGGGDDQRRPLGERDEGAARAPDGGRQGGPRNCSGPPVGDGEAAREELGVLCLVVFGFFDFFFGGAFSSPPPLRFPFSPLERKETKTEEKNQTSTRTRILSWNENIASTACFVFRWRSFFFPSR